MIITKTKKVYFKKKDLNYKIQQSLFKSDLLKQDSDLTNEYMLRLKVTRDNNDILTLLSDIRDYTRKKSIIDNQLRLCK